MKKIKAVSIGSEAARLLRAGATAHIIGCTSKGLFVKTPGSEVFFISYESFRSPITIVLGEPFSELLAVENGEEVSLDASGMELRGGSIRIECGQLNPWVSPRPTGQASTAGIRRERVETIAASAVSAKPDSGFSPLAAAMLTKNTPLSIPPEDRAVFRRIESILRTNTRQETNLVLAEMEGLLGFGRGLTPSGDDFALGFLLAVTRWGQPLGYEKDAVEAYCAGLTRLVEEKTTSLSRMFIRQAALGRGDERHLAVMDGIMTSNPSMELCIKYILETGNSSGIDSFLGMAAGVL
jgi:hypothetical protein